LNLDAIREQIPATKNAVYLNSGWSGPSPRSVVEAIKTRLDYESEEGPTTRPVFESGKAIQAHAKESVASLLNVTPEEILMTQCTTDGLNVVLNGLPWEEGDEVITFGLEHPSVLIPAYHLKSSRGVLVNPLPLNPSDSKEDIINRVLNAITSKTRMLFLSHIQYTCGLKMPVRELRELTKSRGIWMLIDGAQTAGHITLDMRELDCDFYAIPGQKWLLGPDGVGALYIRKEMIPLVKPVRISSTASLAYDDVGNFKPNEDSMDKFKLPTSSVALLAGFIEAIKFHQTLGSEVIEKRNLGLASQLKNAFSEIRGINLLSPTSESVSAGLTSFQVEGKKADDVVTSLWDNFGIVVRQVNELSCVRASSHFFNTEEELEKLINATLSLL